MDVVVVTVDSHRLLHRNFEPQAFQHVLDVEIELVLVLLLYIWWFRARRFAPKKKMEKRLIRFYKYLLVRCLIESNLVSLQSVLVWYK